MKINLSKIKNYYRMQIFPKILGKLSKSIKCDGTLNTQKRKIA